ncbi:hypothetical protein CRG98_028001 [Punica granatum]|uniref:Uncharacterized protein n=1 Tax=Punica granatum TaxID=22663 RepID=A0A2I0J5S2_PUNGR|nr:hypothetical protein CRG98_028001 [Punica granatum]
MFSDQGSENEECFVSVPLGPVTEQMTTGVPLESVYLYRSSTPGSAQCHVPSFMVATVMIVSIAIQLVESYDSTIRGVTSDFDSMAGIINVELWLNREETHGIELILRLSPTKVEPKLAH